MVIESLTEFAVVTIAGCTVLFVGICLLSEWWYARKERGHR
jgi:hypothetical protein